MSDSFQISTILPTKPQQLYKDWLDSEQHSAFTGDPATCSDQVGGTFSAGNGYIQGTNLELEPPRRILQSWRTSDFPSDSEDSILEITLEPIDGETRLTLKHSNIPAGQGEDYREGWDEYYFKPMREFYSS